MRLGFVVLCGERGIWDSVAVVNSGRMAKRCASEGKHSAFNTYNIANRTLDEMTTSYIIQIDNFLSICICYHVQMFLRNDLYIDLQ